MSIITIKHVIASIHIDTETEIKNLNKRKEKTTHLLYLRKELSVNTTEESDTLGLLSIQIDKYEIKS